MNMLRKSRSESLISIKNNSNLNLIKVSNLENNPISFTQVNNSFLGPFGMDDIKNNILNNDSNFKEETSKPIKFNSYFDLFYYIYLIYLKVITNKEYLKYVNDKFQFSIISKNGLCVLHQKDIQYNLNYCNLINFPELKKVSKTIYDTFYDLLLSKLTQYYKLVNLETKEDSKDNKKEEIKEEINILLTYFIEKKTSNFFQEFQRYI